MIEAADRPSFTEIKHRDHIERRRDILRRIEGVEEIASALAKHWQSVASAREVEAESFRPVLSSWRQLRDKRVLVIDDDATLVTLMIRMLTKLGVTADSAPDGEEGLELARATAYDLAIVDLNMEMPGMLVVEELRRSSARPSAPILIVSGVASQEELDAVADECGATAALAKAFTQDDFEATVRRLLAPYTSAHTAAEQRAPGESLDESDTAHVASAK